jgi:hypothetical protein
MTKPKLFIKQTSHITTVKLHGNAWAWAVLHNRVINECGLINAIKLKAEYCRDNNYKYALASYNDLLTGLGAENV